MSCLLPELKEFAIRSAWSYETEFERLRVREMGVRGCYRGRYWAFRLMNLTTKIYESPTVM
jgi:hypothetical protein